MAAFNVNAATISGSIDMNNFGFGSGVSNDGSTLTFSPNAPSSNFAITNASGNFASFITTSEFGVIQDITYNPFAAPTPNFFAFTSTNSGTNVSVVFDALSASFTNNNGLYDIRVYGTLSVTGYDPTPGTWTYSDQGGSSWSATAVPEPSVIALLGLGMLGLGIARRKARRS